jgi:hypothetical protein
MSPRSGTGLQTHDNGEHKKTARRRPWRFLRGGSFANGRELTNAINAERNLKPNPYRWHASDA